jgi:hypothetical protein
MIGEVGIPISSKALAHSAPSGHHMLSCSNERLLAGAGTGIPAHPISDI